MTTYITMRPKLEASQELKKIVSRLTVITEKNFTQKLDERYASYKGFIEEKSTNLETEKSYYFHFF